MVDSLLARRDLHADIGEVWKYDWILLLDNDNDNDDDDEVVFSPL